MKSAWNLLQTLNPTLHWVNVGIVDSGINRNHQEFNNPAVDLGPQIPSSPNDATGHGTAIAGIIGANNAAVQTPTCTNNPIAFQMTGILGGVPGFYYGLRVQGVDLFQTPAPFLANFSAAIDNLAAMQVDVINISWATSLASRDYFMEQFNSHPNILFVIAAGNKGIDAARVTPANVKVFNSITVGATDQDDSRAIFNSPASLDCLWGLGNDCSSNFGSVVDIAAPGTNIWAPSVKCTANTNSCYALAHGTSFSAPLVAGAAAVLKAIEGATPYKILAPQQIRNILVGSADPIVTDEHIGPRLNIFRAVQQALNTPTTQQYSYAGPNFNTVSSGIGTHLTGSIVLKSPLAPNSFNDLLDGYLGPPVIDPRLIDFSFTDGIHTVSFNDVRYDPFASFIRISTDSQGNIINWSVGLNNVTNVGPGTGFIAFTQNAGQLDTAQYLYPDGSSAFGQVTDGRVGSWTASTAAAFK